MQKKALFILGCLIVVSGYVSADNTPTVILSPNDTHTFTWQTCPTDKKPITSYMINVIHNPKNAVTTKQGMNQTKDGCTTYTYTITTHNANPATQFTSDSSVLGSFDVSSATAGFNPDNNKVATIVIKNEKLAKNTNTESKAIPAQVTPCDEPTTDACFAALPLPIPSSTTQPMILSTSASEITYTLDLKGADKKYKGTKKSIVLKQVPNKPGKTGTTYTLATKNAPVGTFLINQVKNGIKTTAYQVTVTEGK